MRGEVEMSRDYEDVSPPNLAMIEAYLSGRATKMDVLDYLVTLKDKELGSNFKDSLEIELNTATEQIQMLLDMYSVRKSTKEGTDTLSDGRVIRLDEVISVVVDNHTSLTDLYAYLVKITLSNDNDFNYSEL